MPLICAREKRSNSLTRPSDGTLVWTFPSLWTNPFFFDYKPWLAAAAAVILVSVVCWLPLIRGLTRSGICGHNHPARFFGVGRGERR